MYLTLYLQQNFDMQTAQKVCESLKVAIPFPLGVQFFPNSLEV